MKRGIFWTGFIVFLAAVFIFFLSGATSNGAPVWPLVYGSDQGSWMLLALIGFVILVSGALMKEKKAARKAVRRAGKKKRRR